MPKPVPSAGAHPRLFAVSCAVLLVALGIFPPGRGAENPADKPAAAVAPAPFKLIINTDSLPLFLFGTDAQNVTVGVAQGYGANKPLECELSVSVAAATAVPVVPAHKVTVPPFEGGSVPLRIPLAVGKYRLPAVLTLRAQAGDKFVDLPILTLQPPQAAAPAEEPVAEEAEAEAPAAEDEDEE